jgi:GMP synthase (glutamine-hydrolysing)
VPRKNRSSRLAVAIRHVAFEDLGNLEASLRAHGFRIVYKDAGVDSLGGIDPGVDLLIVLGGPIGAYEESSYSFIRDEVRLLEGRAARDLPSLGICLGAQLMARALGSAVRPGPRREIGWSRLSLPDDTPESPLVHLEGVPVLHWHGDTFDLPSGAMLLASTESYRNQAFSWGRHALALQFHAEVREAALERWYIGHACEINATPGISVEHLRTAARQCDATLQAHAPKLWQSWLSSFC